MNIELQPGDHAMLTRIAYDKLALVFFRDSTTGRMLRALQKHTTIHQALFMSEYHRRCARDNPSRSSFRNNFGWRFEQHSRIRVIGTTNILKQWDPAFPLRMIVVERERPAVDSMRNILIWNGPLLSEWFHGMSDRMLQRSFEVAESQYIAPRPTDADHEMRYWVRELRHEIEARANGSRRAA